ncbi:MAG: hypothetical protein R2844_12305 [Caldilineales bacterium]
MKTARSSASSRKAEPASDLALVGIYMFDHHIFEACTPSNPLARRAGDHRRDPVAGGQRLRRIHHVHRGWWIDTGAHRTAMLAANDKVLEELDHKVQGFVDKDSRITDNVTVEPHAEIINSVIRGPAIIGEGRVINSYVGPFTPPSIITAWSKTARSSTASCLSIRRLKICRCASPTA